MANLTFAIGANTRTFTLSNAEVTRIVGALKTRYGQINELINEVYVPRDRTPAELFTMWTEEQVRNLKEIVRNSDQQALVATIVDINPV